MHLNFRSTVILTTSPSQHPGLYVPANTAGGSCRYTSSDLYGLMVFYTELPEHPLPLQHAHTPPATVLIGPNSRRMYRLQHANYPPRACHRA